VGSDARRIFAPPTANADARLMSLSALHDVYAKKAKKSLERKRRPNQIFPRHACECKEVFMTSTLFDRPLFVKKDRYIEQLASLEDVLDLFEEWPMEKRGVTYDVISKACRMAAQGVFPLTSLRENIRRFLIKERILANIEEATLVPKRTNDGVINS
jgi:hypothetical protein